MLCSRQAHRSHAVRTVLPEQSVPRRRLGAERRLLAMPLLRQKECVNFVKRKYTWIQCPSCATRCKAVAYIASAC